MLIDLVKYKLRVGTESTSQIHVGQNNNATKLTD
jgi:hypothetical protein